MVNVQWLMINNELLTSQKLLQLNN